MLAQTTTHISLLARVAEGGDPAAWAEFCDRYGELIRNFAARRGLQPSDRDDVMQDVLIALTKAMPGFEYDPQRGKFRSYLKTTVIRAVVRRFCQSDRGIDLSKLDELSRAATLDDEVEDVWEAEWRQYHLRRAMSAAGSEFNTTDLTAFRAYALEGQDAAEVASRLGVSVDSVYQVKSRLLRRLGSIIEQQIAEEG